MFALHVSQKNKLGNVCYPQFTPKVILILKSLIYFIYF